MLFHETSILLKSFLLQLDKKQVVALSDDRLCIWKYINDNHFPLSLIHLFENTVGGLFGVKVYIYDEIFKPGFEEGGYFFFPKNSKEAQYYQYLIEKHNYELDLKFSHPDGFDFSQLQFMDFPLVPSPTERTANPKLIYDFLFISQIDEFIEELSHHAKYHTFFMTSANSLESGYFSNQNKLYSMLALYKFFQKNNNGENREYVIARAALISEIQKIRFHVELLKKALSFGFQTFTDVRAALNNRQSPKIISYNENLGGIGRQKIIHGNVYKIYHRDDIINFPADSIMVAYNTNPEYMSAFLQAKAVIVENTSQLSHTAITCREFNIMGVLGAVGCMNFKDNDFIEIDTINKIIKLCQN